MEGFEGALSLFTPCHRFIHGVKHQVLVYAGKELGVTEGGPALQLAVACFHTHSLWLRRLGLAEFEQVQIDLYGDTGDDWSAFMGDLASTLNSNPWRVQQKEESMILCAEESTNPYRFELPLQRTQHGAWTEALIRQLLTNSVSSAVPEGTVPSSFEESVDVSQHSQFTQLIQLSQPPLTQPSQPEDKPSPANLSQPAARPPRKPPGKRKAKGWKPAPQPKRVAAPK
eukprot:TRINITY_DN40735_c0_g1_i1.p1 TRINITY_DN40735_c0_g1~~TRINITY_DN40735_c0_g1_i1.p1  ORF type:complete len:227 (-),score=39.55 TRINITY_DN40735_c0_g1_i1:273-953(-)